MTREEAIEVLLWHKKFYDEGTPHTNAFDMAIEALQTIDNCDQCEWCCPSDGIPTIHVVRCKDCRYFKKIAERSDSGLCHRDIVASAWKENGYCSRGGRKGGDTE